MPGGWCTSWTAGCRREALVVSLSLAPPGRNMPGRTTLGILGIALGTAVYLSISLAAADALVSFHGISAVAGRPVGSRPGGASP